MASLVAAYGSSHSLMLVTSKDDWIERFRVSDRRMPLYDREGRRLDFDTLLAALDRLKAAGKACFVR